MTRQKNKKGVISGLFKVVEKGRTVTLLALNSPGNLFYLPAKLKNMEIGDFVSLAYKEGICPKIDNIRRIGHNA